MVRITSSVLLILSFYSIGQNNSVVSDVVFHSAAVENEIKLSSSAAGVGSVGEPAVVNVVIQDALDTNVVVSTLQPELQSLPINTAEQSAQVVLGAEAEPATSTFSYSLTKGPLKYQFIELVEQHSKVRHVIWKAQDNYVWAADFVLSGDSIDEVINRVAKAYGLIVDIHENEIAVIGELVK